MQLKQTIILAGLTAAMTLPAFADVSIEELQVRRKGSSVNIRVTVTNPAAAAQKGPVKVVIFVRPNGDSPWQEIKTWTDISKIAPKNRVARDFFDENNKTLSDLAKSGSFEAKATAEGPGAPKVAEKTASFSDKE